MREAAIAAAVAVLFVCGSSLLALKWWLKWLGTKIEHAPLADIQHKVNSLDNRVRQLEATRSR